MTTWSVIRIKLKPARGRAKILTSKYSALRARAHLRPGGKICRMRATRQRTRLSLSLSLSHCRRLINGRDARASIEEKIQKPRVREKEKEDEERKKKKRMNTYVRAEITIALAYTCTRVQLLKDNRIITNI